MKDSHPQRDLLNLVYITIFIQSTSVTKHQMSLTDRNGEAIKTKTMTVTIEESTWNISNNDVGFKKSKKQDSEIVSFKIQSCLCSRSAYTAQLNEKLSPSAYLSVNRTSGVGNHVHGQQHASSGSSNDVSPSLQRWCKEPMSAQPWNAIEGFSGLSDQEGYHVNKRDASSNGAVAGSDSNDSGSSFR